MEDKGVGSVATAAECNIGLALSSRLPAIGGVLDPREHRYLQLSIKCLCLTNVLLTRLARESKYI